ncbi:hypothetical protein ACFE04_027440 [Oxalis oulophora]
MGNCCSRGNAEDAPNGTVKGDNSNPDNPNHGGHTPDNSTTAPKHAPPSGGAGASTKPGGELFDRIIAKGHYTERAAASLLRTIVQIVHTCHSMGVIHRDLKPENFLLLSKDETAPLKATDFGLSVFYKPGDVFKDIVGSAYYIAPEVLKRRYGPEADIWSIGVMLYILLSGVPPFWAESENGIFNAILKSHVDFASDPWPSISPQAKDLVKKMLNADPKQRLTAFQVLNHPWIKEDGEAPDTPLDNAVMSRLKQFKAMNQFKKVALRVIAGCLSEEEIMGLKEMFRGMDTDNSGTITLEELKQGLAKQGTKLSELEVKQLMEAADADGNGTIDYDEFITATMHMNRMDREEHLYTAFQHFDKDNSGYITTDELEQALRDFGMHDGRDIKEIISEVDADHVIGDTNGFDPVSEGFENHFDRKFSFNEVKNTVEFKPDGVVDDVGAFGSKDKDKFVDDEGVVVGFNGDDGNGEN